MGTPRAGVIFCAAALALAPALGRGQQTTPLRITLDGGFTATDNGGFSASGNEQREFITSLRPSIAFARRGAGFEFDLEAAATLLAYANGTRDDGVLPDIRAALKSTLLERLLYVEADARVRQSEVDPFGLRADETLGANRRTQGTYRVSPYLEREFLPDTTLLARHDASLTTNGAGDGTRLVSNYSLLKLERKPVPLGAAAEASRLDNESSGLVDSRFTLDTLRLRAGLRLGDQVVLGAIAGRDRSEWLLSDESDSLYGLSFEWSPGPRTELSAQLEHRFFGGAGTFSLRHRTPFMSIGLAMSRQPVMASASLGVLGQSTDVRGFLDAILTTRYPDPVVRGELVDSLVTSRGLDTGETGPIDVVAEYPQLQTALSATWVLLGTRNTASLTVYTQTLRQLTRDGDALSAPGGALLDSRQQGAALQFNRRLTPQLAADATYTWSKITGLALRDGDVSEEKSLKLSLMQNLSPRTSASVGLQRKSFTTTVEGERPYDATLVLIGMSHRF